MHESKRKRSSSFCLAVEPTKRGPKCRHDPSLLNLNS